MAKFKFVHLAAAAIMVCIAASDLAFADSVVKVTLTDKGGMMDMSKSMGLGIGMHGNMMGAIMGISINPKTVLHGNVKFNVTNSSTSIVHEMLIAPIADDSGVLPFIANENRVDEEQAKSLGEVSELEPGKSGSLTLDLAAGKYILFCNVPGHFMAGMWTVIEVRN